MMCLKTCRHAEQIKKFRSENVVTLTLIEGPPAPLSLSGRISHVQNLCLEQLSNERKNVVFRKYYVTNFDASCCQAQCRAKGHLSAPPVNFVKFINL